jgi:opacity protein-like surface antigen
MTKAKARTLLSALMALGALAVPAAAAAQAPIDDPLLNDPVGSALSIWYSNQTGGYQYDGGGPAAPKIFTLFTVDRSRDLSHQAIAGTFDRGSFVGVAYDHVYDVGADEGHYVIQGTLDPAGIAPPVPVNAVVTAKVDRHTGELWSATIDGTIAGQHIATPATPAAKLP